MQKILIIGATSAIAEATARLFAARGDRLYLLARDNERATTMAADLKIRGAESVEHAVLDVNDMQRHEAALAEAINRLEGLDVALIAHGTLPDQKVCEQNRRTALLELNTNGVSVVSLLTPLANYCEKQGHGVIAVISSVAGDRGRQSNYVYGAAKAMVSVFLQGLRNRLAASGVHVLTIKPGFVDTPMTAAFKKGPLWARPETIARGIARGIEKKKDVVYLPFFWRFIMMIIRAIPESIFKKMSL